MIAARMQSRCSRGSGSDIGYGDGAASTNDGGKGEGELDGGCGSSRLAGGESGGRGGGSGGNARGGGRLLGAVCMQSRSCSRGSWSDAGCGGEAGAASANDRGECKGEGEGELDGGCGSSRLAGGESGGRGGGKGGKTRAIERLRGATCVRL